MHSFLYLLSLITHSCTFNRLIIAYYSSFFFKSLFSILGVTNIFVTHTLGCTVCTICPHIIVCHGFLNRQNLSHFNFNLAFIYLRLFKLCVYTSLLSPGTSHGCQRFIIIIIFFPINILFFPWSLIYVSCLINTAPLLSFKYLLWGIVLYL